MSAYRRHNDEEDAFHGDGIGTVMGTPQPWYRTHRKLLIAAGVTLVAIVGIILIVYFSISHKEEEDSSDGSKSDKNEFPYGIRLPPFVTPSHYSLVVHPDFDKFTFNGTATISVKVTEKTDRIILHSVGLNLSDVTLQQKSSKDKAKISFYSEYEFAIFTFSSLEGWFDDGHRDFTLFIRFEAKLEDALEGFYRSSYMNNGTKEWLATTDFEPTGARRAFPCFDEPAMKANFTITLQIDESHGYNALSNMPEQNRTHISPTLTAVQFQTSVRMSTYLVCYIVSKFQHLETTTDDGTILVRVWASPDTISQGHVALEAGKQAVTNFGTYFNISYPLPKLDMIAIPDFSAGAMENWGLITFRETALLWDTTESSTSNRQRVVTVVCHEIAHQWFGDYVTMEWWNDLWLNEGFASYMEYWCVDQQHPDWQMWEQFLVLDWEGALELDALSTSHPIAVNVSNPDQIGQLFDSISYSKGASVLRMLNAYANQGQTTTDNFRDGLRYYLNTHAYANAETSDLWAALSHVSGKDIAVVMDTWTSQTGYPVIEVSTIPGSFSVAVAQQRFFLLPDNTTQHQEQLWWVPLDYTTEAAGGSAIATPAPLALKQTGTVAVNTPADGWYLMNTNATGFYRVLYTAANYALLSAALQEGSPLISSNNRASLLSDAFSFAQMGLLPPSSALTLSRFLVNETDYAVWATGLGGLGTIGSLIDMQIVYGPFQQWKLNLLEPIVAQLGWGNLTSAGDDDDGTHTEKLLRSSVLYNAIQCGHQPSISTALDIFSQLQSGALPSLNPDLRDVVYRTAVANIGYDAYQWMLARYNQSNVASERNRCLYALAAATEPYLLQYTLELSLTSVVRSQDTVSLVSRVAANIYGRQLAWDFFKDNYQQFYDRYGNTHFALDSLIPSLTQSFSTTEQLQQVTQFLSEHGTDAASMSIQQSLEVIQANINWLNLYLDDVENFFGLSQSN